MRSSLKIECLKVQSASVAWNNLHGMEWMAWVDLKIKSDTRVIALRWVILRCNEWLHHWYACMTDLIEVGALGLGILSGWTIKT